MKMLISLFILVFLVSASFAQKNDNSATLEDTLEWLKKTVNDTPKLKNGYQVREFSAAGCTITYREESPDFWVKTTVPLGALDPLTILSKKIESTKSEPAETLYAIVFYTSEGKNVIAQVSDDEDVNGVSLNNNAITVTDSEQANRIAQALRRAAELCGGKNRTSSEPSKKGTLAFK